MVGDGDENDPIRDVVVRTYYEDQLRVGSEARTAAQGVFSAVAAALGVGLALISLLGRPSISRGASVLLLAGAAFVLAAACVGLRALLAYEQPPDTLAHGFDSFLEATLARVRRERERVSRLNNRSLLIAAAGLLLMMSGLAIHAFSDQQDWAYGTVRTDIATEAASRGCLSHGQGSTLMLTGEILVSSDNDYVVVDLDHDLCDSTVEITRNRITSIELHGRTADLD